MLGEFRRLRYFVAAAGHGAFRRAAAALCVQESTISRAIRDLEDELGASLFHRHIGGVSLTVAGEHFLEKTQKALQLIDEGSKNVAAIGRSDTGRINIGVFSSLASGFLLELLQDYKNNHSGVRIDLVDGDPTEHAATIRKFRIDIAFVAGTRVWTDCECECLWSEKVFVVLPEGHTLAGKRNIAWRDLEEECFVVSEAPPGPEIHDYLVQKLADLGHHPCIQRCKLGRHNLLSLVALGYGLTITSEATTALSIPGIVYRSITGEVVPFSAVWSPRNDNPALRRLLSMARTMSNAAAS